MNNIESNCSRETEAAVTLPGLVPLLSWRVWRCDHIYMQIARNANHWDKMGRENQLSLGGFIRQGLTKNKIQCFSVFHLNRTNCCFLYPRMGPLYFNTLSGVGPFYGGRHVFYSSPKLYKLNTFCFFMTTEGDHRFSFMFGGWGEGCSAATCNFTTRCHSILHCEPLTVKLKDPKSEKMLNWENVVFCKTYATDNVIAFDTQRPCRHYLAYFFRTDILSLGSLEKCQSTQPAFDKISSSWQEHKYHTQTLQQAVGGDIVKICQIPEKNIVSMLIKFYSPLVVVIWVWRSKHREESFVL